MLVNIVHGVGSVNDCTHGFPTISRLAKVSNAHASLFTEISQASSLTWIKCGQWVSALARRQNWMIAVLNALARVDVT